MEDNDIIKLFFERSESGIAEAEKKYHGYCHHIAKMILGEELDVEECLNDTWLKAWNCIPPNSPNNMAIFLGKLTRTTAIDIRRKRNRKCRSGTEPVLILEELEESIPDCRDVESEIEERELVRCMNDFLKTISEFDRKVFICRYWYAESIHEISQNAGASESKIKSVLFRTRKKLKSFLSREGF